MPVKKKLLTLGALLLTAGLALLIPHLSRAPEKADPGMRVTRVWAVECDPALTAWLRKQAAAYEKATGTRIYLRTATREEAQAAQAGQRGVVAPDLLVQEGIGQAVAYLAYALVLRDETMAITTPAPTSGLFYRPTPLPGPTVTPAPTPSPQAISAVLVPEGLTVSLPGAICSRDPLGDFSAGKAPAALLTAGQAAGLTFGYRAYALPAGNGVRTLGALAMAPEGQAFLNVLQTPEAQRALGNHGLYAVLPSLRLYDAASDPLRALIESSLSP